MVNIVLRKDMHESFNVKEVWSGRINVGRSREGVEWTGGGSMMCNSFCLGRRNEMLNVSLLSGRARRGTFPLVSQSTGETLVRSH